MIKISVIIPVYNTEKYLKKCLDSIINQTLKSLEIICIDDCSTDNSLNILKEYQLKDNRIKIIEQKENKGQGVARNLGLNIAEGEYIMFLDPDDWLELNALEILYKKLKETNADIIHFNYIEENEKLKSSNYKNAAKIIKKRFGIKAKKESFYSLKNSDGSFLYKFEMQVWDKIYKKDFILKNNINFAPNKHGEDHLFTIGYLISADKIYYVDEYFYHYTKRNNSERDKITDENFCVFENLKLIENLLKEKALLNKYKNDFVKCKIHYLGWNLRKIPDILKEKYINECKSLLNKKEYGKMLKVAYNQNSILENIFSIKNDTELKRKIITLLGIKFTLFVNKNIVKGEYHA